MADRDEEGKFSERYSTEEFLSAIASLELATTSNVSEEVGCSYDLAYRRLKKLEDEGTVTSQEVRSAFVWFVEE